jgi:hypothetical protein
MVFTSIRIWNYFQNKFSQNKPPGLTIFLQSPPQSFAIEMLWFVQKYVNIFPKEKPKISNLHPTHGNHQTANIHIPNHPFILFHPLQHAPHNPHFTHYNSPHPLFSSTRSAKSSKWNKVCLACHDNSLEAIHWARMVAKEDKHTTTKTGQLNNSHLVNTLTYT